MFENVQDPYDRIVTLELEVFELHLVIEQLSIQVKQTSELNFQLTEYSRSMARAIDHIGKMITNIEFRTTVLETKNEKTISRPLR
jgi:uncharacterized coiled-coil protein SlyX